VRGTLSQSRCIHVVSVSADFCASGEAPLAKPCRIIPLTRKIAPNQKRDRQKNRTISHLIKVNQGNLPISKITKRTHFALQILFCCSMLCVNSPEFHSKNKPIFHGENRAGDRRSGKNNPVLAFESGIDSAERIE
jgi:hypothetical protein